MRNFPLGNGHLTTDIYTIFWPERSLSSVMYKIWPSGPFITLLHWHGVHQQSSTSCHVASQSKGHATVAQPETWSLGGFVSARPSHKAQQETCPTVKPPAPTTSSGDPPCLKLVLHHCTVLRLQSLWAGSRSWRREGRLQVGIQDLQESLDCSNNSRQEERGKRGMISGSRVPSKEKKGGELKTRSNFWAVSEILTPC